MVKDSNIHDFDEWNFWDMNFNVMGILRLYVLFERLPNILTEFAKLRALHVLALYLSAFRTLFTEAAFQRYSQEQVFWKYAANLQENIHAAVWFQ